MTPTYLLQHYLVLPAPVFTHPYTILPRPNVIDKWLFLNRLDAWKNTLIPGFLYLTDTPSDQVLVTVQLSRSLVSCVPFINHSQF